jgi:putative FmdB family regulatory protein
VPTYQYACTACGHQLEAVQSFADDPLTECPTCEGRLRKLFSSVGVVFKGSGFYRTDSRAESRAKADKESSGASASSEKKDNSSEKKDKSSTGSSDSGSSGSGSAGSSGSSPKPSTPAAAAA